MCVYTHVSRYKTIIIIEEENMKLRGGCGWGKMEGVGGEREG